MKIKVKMTIKAGWGEEPDDLTGFGERIVEVEVPFSDNDHYHNIATIEVEGVETPPALINRPGFKCRMSVSRKGMLELTY